MPNLINPYRFAAAAAFDPSDLYAAAEDGFWLDPSDSSTVWTDTGGTSAAGDTDAIARIDDKSGNGNNATQSTAGARPILTQSGALWYLDFDGVDDWLSVPETVTGTSAHSVFMGIADNEVTSSNLMIYLRFGTDATSGGLRDFTNEAGLRVFNGSELYTGSPTRNGTYVSTHIAPASANVTDNSFWRDGVAASVSSSSSRVMDTNSNVANIGYAQATSAGNPMDMFLYSIIVVVADKTSDRADVEAWVADKTGVTL